MTDLERALKTLNDKTATQQVYWKYYDGPQPLKYSTERLKEKFKDFTTHFEENWCSVAVDTLLDRISLRGFDMRNTKAKKVLQDAWADNRMELDSYDAHTAALVTGEAYVIAWPDEDNNTDVYFNDPQLVHIFYRSDKPKVAEFAAKWWQDEKDGTWKMVLYYPDRLEHYTTRKIAQPTKEDELFPDGDNWQEANKYNRVPVFHIRIGRRKTVSIFEKIKHVQDALNKLFADMMVAAEFGAFKQRYVISNSDTAQLKNVPGAVWDIPAGDGIGQNTEAGEFAETALSPYLDAIDRLANFVAIQTKIPKHYFADAGTSGISGDALIALEAPLVAKVEQIEENFGAGWQELAQFILKIEGIEVSMTEIRPLWKIAETVQPTCEATALNVNFQAGIPVDTQLRRQGWTEEELDQMHRDQTAEKQRNAQLGNQLIKKLMDEEAAQNEPLPNLPQNTNSFEGGADDGAGK